MQALIRLNIATDKAARLSIQYAFWQQMIPEFGLSFNQLNIATALNYAGLACGGVIFIPFAIKYGRRPVYLISTAVMAATAFWTARLQAVPELYITNLLSGLAGSTNETIVQMTVGQHPITNDAEPTKR
jgi:MFS family permease